MPVIGERRKTPAFRRGDISRARRLCASNGGGLYLNHHPDAYRMIVTFLEKAVAPFLAVSRGQARVVHFAKVIQGLSRGTTAEASVLAEEPALPRLNRDI